MRTPPKMVRRLHHKCAYKGHPDYGDRSEGHWRTNGDMCIIVRIYTNNYVNALIIWPVIGNRR